MARHLHRTLFIHCIANKRVSAFSFLQRVLHLGWPIAIAFHDLAHIWGPERAWQTLVEGMLALSGRVSRKGCAAP
jgi:hypothetical protein